MPDVMENYGDWTEQSISISQNSGRFYKANISLVHPFEDKDQENF